MERVPLDRLRNVALISHAGAGKTQLAEAMLYLTGAAERFGRVDDGSTIMDFEPEEVERKTSISTALAPLMWRDHKINLLDTPGYFDFVGEVHAALRAADGAVIVCDAGSGVEVGTELVWRYAEEQGLPRLVFVGKMDREHASFDKALDQLQQAFGRTAVPLQLPIGSEEQFRGVVDLLSLTAVTTGEGGPKESSVPPDMKEGAAQAREQLIEAIAEGDDHLLEKYLEGDPVSPQEWEAGLRRAVLAGRLVPVLCGSALSGIGVGPLLDAVTGLLPAPHQRAPGVPSSDSSGTGVVPISEDGPLTGLVFKTMADPYVGKITLFKIFSGSIRSDTTVLNASQDAQERVGQLFQLRGREQLPVGRASAGDIVGVAKLQHTVTGDTLCDPRRPVRLEPIQFPRPVYSLALQPRSKADEDRLGNGLARLAEEDPTFRVERNAETRQLLVYGMGELHIDIITGRLKRKFGVEVDLTVPRVPYRETIQRSAESEFRHKKQTGGRGQYGHVMIRIEPLPRGAGFEFAEEIFGGAVPRQYIPAVEKGVREAMADGVLAGYPVTDVKVVLYDGSYHSVDSSEMAFKIAASQAFKKGFMEAAPVLLEPIAQVAVYVPEEYMGDIMGDLNRRRGRVQGMEGQGTAQVIRALVPLAEMFSYAVDLRSMTQGRGTYTMEISHYEEVPEPEAAQVIEAARGPAAQ